MNVLIVDDSPLMVVKISELLEDVDSINLIESSNSYNDAIQLLTRFNPDVILLDINLHGKSGIELLKYVKIHLPHIKIIMVSNQYNNFYQQLCLELGADNFVDKSKDFESIPTLLSAFA